jgi:hypothetical protein
MGLIKGKHRLGLNANGTYGDTCGFFVRMNQHSTCFLLQWRILTLIME